MFEREYYSSVNFGGHPKSGLEIPSGYAISWGGGVALFCLHTHTQDRLNKSCSALAEALLKFNNI